MILKVDGLLIKLLITVLQCERIIPMKLTWLNNGFICKELYAPFILDNDYDYLQDLSKKYSLIFEQALRAGADDESLHIISKYKKKITEALKCYYNADIAKCNTIIKNLIVDIGHDKLAVDCLNNSYAFHGRQGQEIQFFRCRLGNPSESFSVKEMLFLPIEMRSKAGNYRFSIPGNPSFYLSNSSYGCWIETGFPADIEFNVSPVVLDGTQKIFNLAISSRDFSCLNEFEENRVHCWLKLFMLSIATSYRIKETGRTLKSEYIISQSIMMACKKVGYDGVAYYSKRVSDEIFAFCAINLALFVDYSNKNDSIANHIKMDDSYNFALYKKLNSSLKYKRYDLRSVNTGLITNIGSYERQYPYRETDFYEFDQFLFSTWTDKPNNTGKDYVEWGIK